MPQRRIVTLVSVVVHAIAIVAIVVAQLLAVGPLPTPHRPLAFDDTTTMVQLKDIDLPAPSRSPLDQPSGPTVSANAAPLIAPHGISKETGIENEPVVAANARADANRVENNGGCIDALGVGRGVVPPPPPPPPQVPVRLSSGMQAPRKVVDATPIYPVVARTARVEGVVILEAVIDARGSVETVRVLRSIPLLDQAAVDAVRQWKFTPTLLNGERVPIVMTVTVNFRLQ
jgi:periplasmic protein TonB